MKRWLPSPTLSLALFATSDAVTAHSRAPCAAASSVK